MKFVTAAAALAATLSTAGAAGAAVVSVEFPSLGAFFGGPGVSGSFEFDTADDSFENVAIAGPTGTFGDGTGEFRPMNTIIGFANQVFYFEADARSFYFDIEDFETKADALDVGSTFTTSVFAFHADFLNPDLDPIDPTTGAFVGPVFTTRLADPVDPMAPIPLPATAPLLLGGLGFIAWMRRRSA